MKLLEHEAKAVLRKSGMAVPVGKVVVSPDDVAPTMAELGLTDGVLKAQVFTGGRGISVVVIVVYVCAYWCFFVL